MIDGDKVGTAGHRGVGGSSADRNSIYGKGRRGEERKKRVNREKTHFGRDQADFGVYLYE